MDDSLNAMANKNAFGADDFPAELLDLCREETHEPCPLFTAIIPAA